MDINDLASQLFGKKRTEETSKVVVTNTSTIYGTAHSSSEDGKAVVYIGDNVTLPDDSQGPYVTIPTSPHVEKDDTVAITLIGSGVAKHPYISAVIGSGDRDNDRAIAEEKRIEQESKDRTDSLSNEISDAMDTANSAIAGVQGDIDEFKKTAEATYSTKSEVDEKTGAITKTIETTYATKSELQAAETSASQTYAQKTELKSSVDELSATMTSNYSAFTTYQTTNDAAVKDAKDTGTKAANDLDEYKKTAASTFASQTDFNDYKTNNDSAMSNTQTALNTYKAATDAKLNELTNIADNAIETWYLKGAPTTENEPASTWDTDELKKLHAGDIYFDVDTGYYYRWSGTEWISVKDTDITKALGDIQDIKTNYATKTELSATEDTLSASVSDSLTQAKTYSSGLITQEVADRNAAIIAKANEINQSVSETYTTKSTFTDYKTSNDSAVADAKAAGTKASDDLDAYKVTASTTYATKTELNQTNDSISSEVTARKQTDTTVTNLSDNLSKNYSTTEQMNSAINQRANSITSTVSTKIEQMTVGGRNLLYKSANSVTWSKSDVSSEADKIIATYDLSTPITVNTENSIYTITFYGAYITDSTISTSVLPVYLVVAPGNRIEIGSGDDFVGVPLSATTANNASRISATFSLEDSTTDFSKCDLSKLEIWLNTSDGVMYPIFWDKIKLERGNKSTDWTPAPEDMTPMETTVKMNTSVQQVANALQIDINTVKSISDANAKNVSDQVDNLNSRLSDEIENRKSYFRFAEEDKKPVLELGASDSKAQAKLTNEQLQFLYEQAIVAYIGNNAMLINNAIINNALFLGDFAFIPRSNGNLAFKWVGEDHSAAETNSEEA